MHFIVSFHIYRISLFLNTALQIYSSEDRCSISLDNTLIVYYYDTCLSFGKSVLSCTYKDLLPRKLNSRNTVLLVAHFHALLPRFWPCSRWRHVARKPECGTARGTHIKAVDKRKGALIVRRSSIHEVGGYGYTYVLRCMYTTCAHGQARPVRVHTRGPLACMEPPRVVTGRAWIRCHAWSRHIRRRNRSGADREREREREGVALTFRKLATVTRDKTKGRLRHWYPACRSD